MKIVGYERKIKKIGIAQDFFHIAQEEEIGKDKRMEGANEKNSHDIKKRKKGKNEGFYYFLLQSSKKRPRNGETDKGMSSSIGIPKCNEMRRLS